jgi:hypothetical protein
MINSGKKNTGITKNNFRFVTMFTKRLLVLTILAAATQLHAQKGLRFGPSASFLSSRTYVTDSLPDNFNFRFKSGFSGGLSVQYGFTDRFVLGTGATFTNKGYRVFNDSNNNGNLIKHNFNNIEIPVNAIFKLRIGAASKMRALIGGTFNVMLDQTNTVLKNNNGTFVISETTINKTYPMLNLGIEIASENKGGGVLIFGVYYKQAFANQTELSVYNSSDLSKPRNFSLGYRGSYIGIGFSYLFDVKNLKKSEEFFY